MDMPSKKLELLDWLMHLTDSTVLQQLEKLKQQFSPEKPTQPVFGRLKGKIVTTPDFDAPLEDFKEYME